MKQSQLPKQADKYIFFGSLPSPLPEKEAKKLISGFKQMMDEPWVRLINTNGKNLGSYLTVATMEASMNLLSDEKETTQDDVISPTENDLCINYLPIQSEFCLGDKTYDDLLSRYWEHRLSIEMDVILGIFIGGGVGTRREFELCKKHGLPCIGLPWYGGTEKEVFDEVTASRESLLKFFPHLSKKNEEDKEYCLKEMNKLIKKMKSTKDNANLLFDIYETFTPF